jgi:YVTN family beta-propeller protein
MSMTNRLAGKHAVAGLALALALAGPPPSRAGTLDGTLLVANRHGGSISFIDLPTRVEIARVPVGPSIPHEVAASPDGRLALTSEYGPDDRWGRHVILMDVATASVVARIDLGPHSRPHTAVFLPGGRHAVATMQESDRLALLDLETRSVVRTWRTGGREGHMVRVSPDGSRAYVASRSGKGTLSVIFLNEERPPVVIETGPGAEGLAVTPDGREIWVANRQVEFISVIDAASLQVVATLLSRPFAGRIEMSPDGHAVVPNGGVGDTPVPQMLQLWSVKTRSVIAEAPLRDGTPQIGHFGLLVHGDQAFVSDPDAGTIQVFGLDGLKSRQVLVDHHDAPDGMAWTPVCVNVETGGDR